MPQATAKKHTATPTPQATTHRVLSEELQIWLNSSAPKTIGGLIDAFDERSFAMLFFLLMFPAALPIPTAGITHVFEVIVILVAFETLIGRNTVWHQRRLGVDRLGNYSAARHYL